MSGTLTRKYALPPPAGRNPYDWFGRGGIEEWVGQTCSSSPGPLRRLGLQLHGSSRREAASAAFGSKPPGFLPEHPRGPMQAWALWPGFCVCVCSCRSCPLREARLWHPVPFSSLPLHLEPSQPRSTARYSGVAAALLSARRMPTSGVMPAVQLCQFGLQLVFPQSSLPSFFSLLQCTQLGSSLKTFSYNPHMLRVR